MRQVLFSFLAIIGMLFGTVCQATTFTVGNLSYTVLTEEPAEVSVQGAGKTVTTGDIVIPSEVEYNDKTYQVTKVASGFFEYTGITSVSIPASVTTISGGAFQSCTGPVSVDIAPKCGETILRISVFEGCTKLASVSLPSSITEIKTTAFKNCSKLAQITAYGAAAPTSISTSAFTGVTLGNISVKVLSSSAQASFADANYFKNMKEIVVTPIELADDTENNTMLAKYDGLVADVEVSRTLNVGGYNSLCLPFAMNAAQISAAFGTCDIQALTDANVSANELELVFNQETETAAGVPYLIQVNETKTSFSVQNVTLRADVSNVQYNGVQFIGIYSPTVLPDNGNLLYVGAGNQLFYSTGGEIGGLRAYFDISGVPAGARSAMRLSFGGTTTDMPSVKQEGTCVKRLEHGVLVIERNGVKYSVTGERL